MRRLGPASFAGYNDRIWIPLRTNNWIVETQLKILPSGLCWISPIEFPPVNQEVLFS